MAPKPTSEGRKCPECDSKNIKSIEKIFDDKAPSGPGAGRFVTVRYKCQKCLETWKETVPAD